VNEYCIAVYVFKVKGQGHDELTNNGGHFGCVASKLTSGYDTEY